MQRVGTTNRGEAIYYSKKDGFAVEKDYSYLAKPTKEEMKEINNYLGKWWIKKKGDKSENKILSRNKTL